MIRSMQQLEQKALEWGFLPFFKNGIEGFSVDELTPRELWFAREVQGPWDWKGPVIREWNCAYGKFFDGKAGFVSLAWLPDLLNYRRHAMPLENMHPDAQKILTTLRSHESMLSNELKLASGFTLSRGNGKNKNPFAIPDDKKNPRNGTACDKHLKTLEMAGYVCIADFAYKYTKSGDPYGWGVALYCTPEAMYGEEIATCVRCPEESYLRMKAHLQKLFPNATERAVEKILTFKH